MMSKKIPYLIATFFAAVPWFGTAAAQPVIPGGVGFGMDTAAGRGGQVMTVSNLNDSGAGSLRECVDASGPRICVFEVSGTIRLNEYLTVEASNLTIAGQTAPAPGITLRGAGLVVRASDVLVQHIAIRPGDDSDGPKLHSRDAVKILGTKDQVHNVVFDHCSLSWAIDEVVEVWGANWDNVTLSNNIISEPLRDAPAAAGKDQGYAVLVDATPGRIAFIGNLFAHAHNRSPRSAAGEFVFTNNVVYNAGVTQLNLFNGGGLNSRNSIVGNVFMKGIDTTADMPVLLNGTGVNGIKTAIRAGTEIYLSDNSAAVATSDPWSIVRNDSDIAAAVLKASSAPVWLDGYDALRSGGDTVLEHVTANAGSRPADRDPVDSRVIDEVRSGSGQIINCVAADGSSRCSKNAGGWPDGGGSTRELAIPADPGGDDDGDGYTNVEEWLQQMAAQVEGRAGIRPDQSPDGDPPKPPVLH